MSAVWAKLLILQFGSDEGNKTHKHHHALKLAVDTQPHAPVLTFKEGRDNKHTYCMT